MTVDAQGVDLGQAVEGEGQVPVEDHEAEVEAAGILDLVDLDLQEDPLTTARGTGYMLQTLMRSVGKLTWRRCL